MADSERVRDHRIYPEKHPDEAGAEIPRMKLEPSTLERILLVRLSALGDCLAAVPVFHALRKRFPKAHIAWVVQDNFAPLLGQLPGLDEIIVFPRRRWLNSRSRGLPWGEARQFIRHLRLRRFRLAVDVQSNTKSSLIAFLSRAPVRIGHGGEEARELSAWFNTLRIPPAPGEHHIVQRNLGLLRPLGIEPAEPDFTLPPDPYARRRMLHWLHSQGLREQAYDLLVPFCGQPEKEWPPAHFTALAGRLAQAGRPTVMLLGPGKEQETRDLLPAPSFPLVILGPQTNIPEMAELVRMARVCAGGDTGPVQIAGALGVPTICLFGPTDPRRSRPWSNSCPMPLDSPPEVVFEAIRRIRE